MAMTVTNWPGADVAAARRQFLNRSALGLGSIALAQLLADDVRAIDSNGQPFELRRPHFRPTAKRVIFLFMAGGPSQLDLFDPKPTLTKLHDQPLPTSYLQTLNDPLIKGSARALASPRRFAKHGRCGMEFSDLLPHLARRADDLCMVRSVATDSSNHDSAQLLLNCGVPLFGQPAMGSWVGYGLGSECRNLPGFVVLLSNSGKGVDGGAALWSNGFLPSAYRGVTFRSKGDAILHLSNPDGIDAKAQRRRLDAIGDLNRLRRAQTDDREIDSRIAAYELAFRMQMAAPELVDFSKESPRTLAEYGIGDKTTHDFGTNCLLARRMAERGVRFIQLYHSTWDDHSELNRNLKTNAAMTDRPAAALIADLKRLGMLDDTLVIWGGEFGRAPMYEVRRGFSVDPEKAGRDHHSFAFTMLVGGGGIKGGQVVGKTDELGYHPVEDRVHVHDLQATILHCLGLDHAKLTYRHQGRDYRLTDVAGNVVRKLLV